VVSGDRLRAELSQLRKGGGLRRPHIAGRIGPTLRRVCGIGDDAQNDARERLLAVLVPACAVLSTDLGLAARVMLAVDSDYPDPTLTGRQSRLAATWGVDPITARRRCDLALDQLAAYLADRGAAPWASDDPFRRDEWYLVSSSTVLRLDTSRPEANRRLTVGALADELGAVDLGLTVPRPRTETRPRLDVEVEVQFGAVLESTRRLSTSYLSHRIRFPRPLRRGETHTFGLLTRIPAGQLMAPFFVSRTQRRTDRMELRVRFDRARQPTVVWRVAGIPYGMSDGDGPSDQLLEPDGAGEVVVAFDRLVLGLGYGVAWLPRLPDHPAAID